MENPAKGRTNKVAFLGNLPMHLVNAFDGMAALLLVAYLKIFDF
jgi:hypothetical protein